MKNKQERLLEVYDYVRAHCNIHTKTAFAKRLQITQPAMSAAINGNEAYLTKNLFQKICGAFPGVFNLNYLLTGQGELLAPTPVSPELKQTQTLDVSLALEKIVERTLRDVKKELNDCYSKRITSLESQVSVQNKYIAILETNVKELGEQLNRVKTPYPSPTDYTPGVAENKD